MARSKKLREDVLAAARSEPGEEQAQEEQAQIAAHWPLDMDE
jgi:hypothetical protein